MKAIAQTGGSRTIEIGRSTSHGAFARTPEKDDRADRRARSRAKAQAADFVRTAEKQRTRDRATTIPPRARAITRGAPREEAAHHVTRHGLQRRLVSSWLCVMPEISRWTQRAGENSLSQVCA